MSISSIINKTEFIKTCSIASFIFTGSAAIIAWISCYVTFENYKRIKENNRLLKSIKLIICNDKINKRHTFENTENIVKIVPPKSPEFIVVQDKNSLCEGLIENDKENDKDYLDMFEEYYDVVPDNNGKKEYGLYKLFGWNI